MNGYISIVITVMFAVIALYGVSRAFYAIYRTFKGHFDHDICYASMYEKGKAYNCQCPGKSEPECTDCPYFTYLQLDTLTNKFVDKSISEVIRDLEEK